MSNTINSIHYCVTIDLINNGQDNAVIGMESGVIRYVSDGLDMASGYMFEDTTPVTNTFYSDVVSKNGFGTMSSKIDIATGGDYGFLQEFKLTLANITSTGDAYHKELDAEDTYVIGGEVSVYVIIDNILYQRWSGSVESVTFNASTFNWHCKDSHNATNNTIVDKPYGMIKQSVIVDTDSADILNPLYSSEIFRVKPDFSLSSMFEVGPGESKIAPPMSDSTTGDATAYGLVEIEPHETPGAGNDYDYNCSTIQTESDYFQIHIANNPSIDMDKIVHVSVDIGGEVSGISYPVKSWDTYIDMYGNNLIRILVKGKIPIAELLNEYGGYEDLPVGYFQDTLEKFEGTLLRLYDVGTKILDGFNVDNIDELSDRAGNIIDKSVITQIGNDYYLPYNVITYKQEVISNDSILQTYSNEESFSHLNVSSFTDSYQGIINPTIANNITHLLFDSSNISLNLNNYDKVFLGTSAYKKEQYREYSGSVGGYSTQFVFDNLLENEDVSTWCTGYLKNQNETATVVDCVEQDLKRSLANGINVTIGNLVFDSYKYGLIIQEGDDDINMFIPYGQILSPTWDGVTSNLRVTQIGGTNLPQGVDYNADIPKIIANDMLPLCYPLGTLLSSAISVMNQREFEFFSADLEATDSDVTTSPDIKELLVNDKFFVNISSEYFQSTVVWMHRDLGSPVEIQTTINSNELLDVPAYINFSFIGQNNNSSSDIFAKYNDDDVTTGTNTLDKVLSDLTDTTVTDLRPTYFVGKYIDEQVNKFNIITQLCKQSFIGGWTNRTGEVAFKRLLEFDNDNAHNHSYVNILDNSIKDFRHTPTSKVFNEFEVKYCYQDDVPQKTLEIHNVDQDEFPPNASIPGSDISNNSTFIFSDASTCTSGTIKISLQNYANGGYDFIVGDTISITMASRYNVDPTINGDFVGEITTVSDDGFYMILALNPIAGTTITTTHTGSFPVSVVISAGVITYVSFVSANVISTWQTWVVGISDYNTAKSFWLKAQEGYLRTGVIRVAPSNRTDLTWATERDWFNDTNVYDSAEEYGYDYFSKLVDWTIFQKFIVSYSLPITSDNVQLELLDDVIFSDPIITPEDYNDGYAKGWITKYELDPKSDKINVSILFEPNNLNPGVGAFGGGGRSRGVFTDDRTGTFPFTMDSSAFEGCALINEQLGNVDIVDEIDGNTDLIEEQKCPN